MELIIKKVDRKFFLTHSKIVKKLRNIILDFFNNNISELNSTYGLSLENINDIVFLIKTSFMTKMNMISRLF